MTNKHRWAEVLVALSEGKEIQAYYHPRGWGPALHKDNPVTDLHLDWRVKPEDEPKWQEILRQAVKDGRIVQYSERLDVDDWIISSLNEDPNKYEFGIAVKEYNYRIKPKIVRWLWMYKQLGFWRQCEMYLTEAEAKNIHGNREIQKLEYTEQEFNE